MRSMMEFENIPTKLTEAQFKAESRRIRDEQEAGRDVSQSELAARLELPLDYVEILVAAMVVQQGNVVTLFPQSAPEGLN
jgi:hypothetical protein